jgi:hypothetical protein
MPAVPCSPHDAAVPCLGQQVRGLEEPGEGGGGGHSGADEHAGRGEVVEEPEGLAGVKGRDRDVQNAACGSRGEVVEKLEWLAGVKEGD